MNIVSIDHGLATIQATPEDCALLYHACELAAEHHVTAAPHVVGLHYAAAAVFHATAAAALAQRHILIKHMPTFHEDLDRLLA
jgi:hypothetical protein